MLTLDGIDRSFLNRAGIYLPKLVHATSFAGGYPCCCRRRGSSTSTSTSTSTSSTSSVTSSRRHQGATCSTGLCIDEQVPLELQFDLSGFPDPCSPPAARFVNGTWFTSNTWTGSVGSGQCQTSCNVGTPVGMGVNLSLSKTGTATATLTDGGGGYFGPGGGASPCSISTGFTYPIDCTNFTLTFNCLTLKNPGPGTQMATIVVTALP